MSVLLGWTEFAVAKLPVLEESLIHAVWSPAHEPRDEQPLERFTLFCRESIWSCCRLKMSTSCFFSAEVKRMSD